VDAKNSPINQTLDSRQKQFLAFVGDSVQKAWYPSQVLDTFSVNKILYKKIDTVFNDVHDSVYVYSTSPDHALYSLSFTETGQGAGNYIQDEKSAANGKVFKWVAPDSNNNKQGRYEPVILLVAPKKQKLLSMGADYAISGHTIVTTEMAVSSYDNNGFSSKDKSDDQGYAAKLVLTDNRQLKNSAADGLHLLSQLSYEWVQNRFRPIERLRTVEFYRGWGLPLNDVPAATENLFQAGVQLNSNNGNTLQFQFENYRRNDTYNGFKNSIVHKADYGNWHFNNLFSITNFNQQDQKGYYVKPMVDVSRDFPKMGNYRLGGQYLSERNYVQLKQYDSLNAGSFSYETWQAYIKSPLNKPNKWGVTYYTRSDKYPYQSKLVQSDRSSNINAYAELMKNDKHQLRVNVTYRNLYVIDSKVTSQQPEQTVLSRAEYFINEFKGLINGNLLYEVGTGQEQKRDFAYVEVPPGQGEYTWNDYNNNGIPELNEFELALFRDQGKYIRIFTPTNEFIKANYLQFNYSVVINPHSVIDVKKANGFNKFLTRLYFQSSLQIYKKENSDNLQFNPFAVPLSDTSLILLNQVLSNSFSFNRYSSAWGFDLNNIRTSNKAFLTYGYESRKVNGWNVKGRWNINRSFLLELSAQKGQNGLVTPNFDNRNYYIESKGIEPRISFVRGTSFRVLMGYKYENKNNTDSTQKAVIHSLMSEVKYNVLSKSSITARFTYSQINYTDPGNNNIPNTSVSYIMLDALLPGKNFLWTIDFTKRLASYLELNFQYEGRKAGTSNTVHIGRASLRALF
ncbi:MAG TPA: hypothetical protein VFV68_08015, partial [Agriterribacter sp.]|nr:hypothetical protein [Agriterribacter sp.]